MTASLTSHTPSPRPARRRHRSRRWLAAGTTVLGSVVAACGISADSGFQENDDLVVGPEPVPTTTAAPTTTTTTTVPQSVPPPETAPDTTLDSSPTTTANEHEVQTELVTLYFVGGSPQEEMLTATTRPLSYPTQHQQVLSALIEGPPERESPGLRTLIDEDLVQNLSTESGVLTIDLNGGTFFDLDTASAQRSAIAQLVLTFGRRPGVGQVGFTQDGEPLPVQVPLDNGGWRSRSNPVAADEFDPMLTETQLAQPDDLDVTTTEPDDNGSSDGGDNNDNGDDDGDTHGTGDPGN